MPVCSYATSPFQAAIMQKVSQVPMGKWFTAAAMAKEIGCSLSTAHRCLKSPYLAKDVTARPGVGYQKT